VPLLFTPSRLFAQGHPIKAVEQVEEKMWGFSGNSCFTVTLDPCPKEPLNTHQDNAAASEAGALLQ
jgi:hypothetical protein